MKGITLLAVVGLALAAPARGQAPASAPPPTAPSPVAAPDYRVGPGDVLEVTVFGNDDLSRTSTVQTSGVIALPLLGEVEVAGLTLPEVQRKLTTLLARDYLVNPQVEVKVKEYQSQFVSVVGEVNSPGRKSLRGRTRLIDVLVEAGGFTPRASGDVQIARREGSFEGGARILRMRLSGSAPSPQDQVNLEVPLRNGDLITALPKYYVTVEGEIVRPGRYPIEGELTITGAISTAGGLTRFGSSNLKVRRVDPETGQTRILDVDLKAVRKGKEPDLALLSNDVVSVPRRLF
ncbi:MAG TPA: polysaccharide biosynthesis/export family protein [Vicinamibacteria bacterium]|nr:polysaccharide biosynthesis/export family protein [Vicinamibacteria bacterium]